MLSHWYRQLAFGLAISLLAASAFAASMDATAAGWDPLVALFGSGDKSRAVSQITAMNHAVGISIRNTKREKAVQDFIDDTIENLADFDLRDFHRRLPGQSGEFRELAVRGEVRGDAYIIEQAKSGSSYAIKLDGRNNALAAMSVTLQAKETKAANKKNAYTLRMKTGIGIGDIRWSDAMTTLEGLVRIGSIATPALDDPAPVQASAASRAAAKKLHPKLSSEDLDVIALIWEAYPGVSAVLSEMGSVEDVRSVKTNRSYQQFSVTMRGQPERLAKHYPALASHLRKMDDIALFDVTWKDGRGRSLSHTVIDTETLTFKFDCFVKNGQLLPFRGAQVFEDEPIDPRSDALDGTNIVVDARVRLLGVTVKLKQLKLEMIYKPNPHYAHVGVTLSKVPREIDVQGAALGFLPTGLIDAFIPGNIESITRDFLTVAAHGNGGQGMVIAGNFGTRDEAAHDGVIEAGFAIDALDNLIIKIGIGMVNERLVPSSSVVDEGKAFATAVQTAFSKDFSAFERHGASASR